MTTADLPTYVQRRRPTVGATRFDGTLRMAQHLAALDDEHLLLLHPTHRGGQPLGTAGLAVLHPTLGRRTLAAGDWIVNDDNGEWYVLRDDQFRACYEPTTDKEITE